jgi:hypothetical protein
MLDQTRYANLFGGHLQDDKKRRDALQLALEIRKFEIELY